MSARRTLALLTVILSSPALLRAHEKGALHLGQKSVATGSNLDLRGERLPKNATITLQLRGALATFPLGEMKTDTKGVFQGSIGLPPEARAGSYTIVAVAGDGDKVAETALQIVAAEGSAHDMADHGTSNTSPEATEAPHPSAEMMPIQAATSRAEWATIAVLIGAGLAGGLLLLRRPQDSVTP